MSEFESPTGARSRSGDALETLRGSRTGVASGTGEVRDWLEVTFTKNSGFLDLRQHHHERPTFRSLARKVKTRLMMERYVWPKAPSVISDIFRIVF
ncbi:unnamed protein product [Protopolystoma xenopodis]|uniref:PDE1 N-terminal domain-containing protein n=1 Tax=Protopolystoma xenopodis TaxID=117903 RepID=A0A448WVA7_9PLAT|nr:unnamed protein product [Protopolystoma xenopodis]